MSARPRPGVLARLAVLGALVAAAGVAVGGSGGQHGTSPGPPASPSVSAWPSPTAVGPTPVADPGSIAAILVAGPDPALLLVTGDGALARAPAPGGSPVALVGLPDGRLLATDADGTVREGTRHGASVGPWGSLSLPSIPDVGAGPLVYRPVPGAADTLVAVVPDPGGALHRVVTLDRAGVHVATGRGPVEGPFAPIGDGQILVIVRDRADRAVLAVLDSAGAAPRQLGIGAHGVAAAGATVALWIEPAGLATEGLADALEGRPASANVPGPPGASAATWALDALGRRLVVGWQDADGVPVAATILEQTGATWTIRTQVQLPAGSERVLVAWWP